jgi:hypothetical protein
MTLVPSIPTNKAPRRIVCPACRALGSGEDCVERIGHARREKSEPDMKVTEYDEPEFADLEVVVRFSVSTEVDGEPLRQKALALQAELADSPDALIAFVDDYSSYDVQVLTPAEHG